MDQTVADKLNRYFDKYETKTYAKGSIITLANQEPEGVSFLIDGVVEQYDITPEGNKIIVNIFKPKTFFPMSWAINKTPNIYFYGALTNVKLKQAGAKETVKFLQANPDVIFNLLSRVYKGTDGLLKRLALATSDVAANRLIFELLIDAYRFGTDMSNNKKLINVKQSILAARSGLARETVTRELQKLENENLITRSRQGITINIKTLEKKLDINI